LADCEHSNSTGPAHTLGRFTSKLEIPRGVLGMTWKLKIGRVAFGLAIVAALAFALAANYYDNFFDFLF